MNIKQFLKPDWRKIVIFVIIFLITSFLRNFYKGLEVSTKYGFPIIFYNWDYYAKTTEFNFVGILVDLIIWYLLSCFIVWIFDKVKKKK